MKYALTIMAALGSATSAFAQMPPPLAPAAVQAPSASTGQELETTTSPAAVAALPIPAPLVRHGHLRPSAAELRVRAANTAATKEPAADAFINAVQIYPFSDGVLYRLFAAPERITDIALQPGEAIVSVAAGDTVRWTVGDTTSGTAIRSASISWSNLSLPDSPPTLSSLPTGAPIISSSQARRRRRWPPCPGPTRKTS